MAQRQGSSDKRNVARVKQSPIPAETQPRKKRETPMEFIASTAVVLVIGLFIITLNMQAFEIPSSSMENTLLVGDHVFVDRLTLAPKTQWAPFVAYDTLHRGDIVVFYSPAEPDLHLVKRVIGLPGDRIHLENGNVFRNGEKLAEPYVIHSVRNYDPFRDEFPKIDPPPYHDVWIDWQLTMAQHVQNGNIVVPSGTFFAMGDNRDVSRDSRYFGFVPFANVVGRPLFIYWSFNTPDDQYLKTDLADRVAFAGKMVAHFFTETRWNRMFRLVR